MIKDKVAFLGPQGTFSHEAASLVSDNLISYLLFNTAGDGCCRKRGMRMRYCTD